MFVVYDYGTQSLPSVLWQFTVVVPHILDDRPKGRLRRKAISIRSPDDQDIGSTDGATSQLPEHRTHGVRRLLTLNTRVQHSSPIATYLIYSSRLHWAA